MMKKQNPETTTFELNEVETLRLRKFCDEHRKHARHVTAGEMIRVIFTPTMLGTISEVQCFTCGKVEDLTDYDQW